MSYTLKYRPKDFSSVVGQKFVKETLREAIKQDKLVGAYLFCGPRGTGKTSIARIFAKTINCLNPSEGNPCHNCDICKAFIDNKLIDIIEIDAASHTGVDNIRDIIEKAQFVPNKTRFKVYIIDEVHMLSPGAFNALLKILEEPPSFVKFVLATTEIHKIPETILSRCQRYDFKNIEINDIKEQLGFIAKKEKIEIDDKSLDYIAKNSSGALRNALVLFEQLITGGKISYENIVNNLGISDEEFLKTFLEKLLKKDKDLIDDFDEIINSGKNIKLFFKDLIYLTRDEIKLNIRKNSSFNELLNILLILDETFGKTKNSMDENITFLSGLLKIINSQKGNDILEVFEDLDKNKGEKIIKKEKTKPIISEKKSTKLEESELNISDIEDVFAEKKVEVNENLPSNFSLNDLISNIKDLGGKGSLTMGIRGSKVNFDGEKNLFIKFPTKIALKSADNMNSREIIVDAMKKMGFENVDLKIE